MRSATSRLFEDTLRKSLRSSVQLFWRADTFPLCSRALRQKTELGQYNFDSLAADVRATLEKAILDLYPADKAAAVECVHFLDHCNELLDGHRERLYPSSVQHVEVPQERVPLPPLTPPKPPPLPNFGLETFWPAPEAAQRFLQPIPARFELPGPASKQLGATASAADGDLQLQPTSAAAAASDALPKKPRGRLSGKRMAEIAAEAAASKTGKRNKADEVQLPLQQQVALHHCTMSHSEAAYKHVGGP